MREGYKDIEFIKIPETWNAHILGSESPLILKEIRNGLTISQSKENGKYKVSRIETISNETIDETRVRYIDEIDDAKLDKYLIRKGEILFSHINSDPHLGKTAIAERDYDDLLHGMNLLLFKANEKVIDPLFLNNIFKLYRQIGVFLKIRSRAVNQSSINQNKLKNLQIPLPPLPEQRKIAYVLSTVQKAIEQQDKLIRLTTELKKALMQKLFTEGTKGEKQKQTEIGLVPESWEVVQFDDLFDFIKSQSHSRSKLTDKETKSKVMTIHYGDIHSTFKYEIVNLKNETLPYILDEFDKEVNNQYLRDGDILLADASEDLIDIGKSIEVLGTENKKVVGGLHTIALRPKLNRISLGYGAFVFRQINVIKEIRFMATGLSVYGISKGNLRTLLIPLPTLEEQKLISQTIQIINSKIEFYQKKKQTLSDLFKTLLHELMTGQRRVHEIEFEAIKKENKIKKQPLSMAAEK